MTPNQFYYAYSRKVIEAVCKRAETTFGNFKQIAVAGGSCGKALAEKLAKASQEVITEKACEPSEYMTELEILYPERYEGDSPEESASAA